jgi:hypothetical protein
MHERDVFIAALQLQSRAERPAYLDDACGGDEALRRRVEALLEAHDRAGRFLQEPVLGPLAAAPQDHAAGAQPAEAAGAEPPSLGFLAPPQEPDELGRLGHYRVLRLLGQGGMGMVFLADDTRLQRPVALKVMRPELAANPQGRQRFLREARAAVHVCSDHVVTIYHVDQEGDVPYLVMEVLRGQSLAEALEQGTRLPVGLCLKIARETAEGLAAAHATGLIHRDVKPGNIWLEEPTGWVKLLDFGLARGRTGPLITQRHVILGTPAYMSPEQAAGQPLDAHCDLFSLGAVLYHMLTGRRPFSGDDVMAVLSSLASDTPPPAAGLVPGLPGGVADLLDRLLAKDPASRPASAADVARALLALEQEAAGLAPSARELPEPTGAETTAPSAQRRRRLALAGGLVLAGLVVGLLAAALTGVFPRRRDDGRASADAVASAPATPPVGLSRSQAGPAPAPGRPAIPPLREFVLTGHASQVQSLAFTADGQILVSAEYRGRVVYWDMDRREPTFELEAGAGGLLDCLALDPRRRWLAVSPSCAPGQVHPGIRLFRFGESVAVGLLKNGHTDRVVQLAFLQDGRTLLSTGYDGSIRRWDVEKQQEGKPLRTRGPRIDCLNVWEDGHGGMRLALAGFHFAGLDDEVLERFPYGNGMAALSPDGTRLACSKQERIARAKESFVALWELPGKTRLGEFPDAPLASGLAFTPDGKHVVVMGADYTRIYETAGGKPVARVDHPEKAVALAVSPDARWLAVGTLKGTVRVWHLPSLLAPRS